jgi:hypothetical protein
VDGDDNARRATRTLKIVRALCTSWSPASTVPSVVEPSDTATLIEIRFARGATPTYRPADELPSPAISPAMNVP